ncbi:MAG: RDD family protein [Pseudomonadales bacterium]|nr:RDD family protein [Pseudomonadales bacterium]
MSSPTSSKSTTDPTSKPNSSEYPRAAGLFRRLAAMLYDGLLVTGIMLFGTLLVILVKSAIVGGEVQALPSAGVAGWLFQGYLVAILFGFFILFWIRSGRTLGMQVWHLHIEDEQGGPITVQQAFKRLLGALLSASVLGLGYLWILFDTDRCAWHDRLSGTRIKWVPKKKKPKGK